MCLQVSHFKILYPQRNSTEKSVTLLEDGHSRLDGHLGFKEYIWCLQFCYSNLNNKVACVRVASWYC